MESVGILILFLTWRKGFQLFTVQCDVICGVFCKWTYVEIFSPVSIDSVLLWIDIEVCQIQIIEAFSASMEMDMWFLSFLLLIRCITWFTLWTLSCPCIPGINSSWPGYILFMYCWIQCVNILLRIFTSIFIRDIHL